MVNHGNYSDIKLYKQVINRGSKHNQTPVNVAHYSLYDMPHHSPL